MNWMARDDRGRKVPTSKQRRDKRATWRRRCALDRRLELDYDTRGTRIMARIERRERRERRETVSFAVETDTLMRMVEIVRNGRVERIAIAA